MIREEDELFERDPFNEVGEVVNLVRNLLGRTSVGIQEKESVELQLLAPACAFTTYIGKLYIYANYVLIFYFNEIKAQSEIILHAKELENC